MPTITIEIIAGRSKEQKSELVRAITDDVVRIARTKAENVTVYIREYTKENVARSGVLRVDQEK